MKRKNLFKSLAVISIISAVMPGISCGKGKTFVLVNENEKINETSTISNEVINESSTEDITLIEPESSVKITESEDTALPLEKEEEVIPLIEGISGITPKEIESKTYNEVKQNLYEYALSDPERAKTITVEEYYGEDVCKLEYEKMKEEYSSFPASFWDEFTYDVFASESIYEECNLGYDPEADKKAYEEMQKRWAEEANSSGGGYVPGQVNNPLNGDGGTGTTWESYNSGLGEANLQ